MKQLPPKSTSSILYITLGGVLLIGAGMYWYHHSPLTISPLFQHQKVSTTTDVTTINEDTDEQNLQHTQSHLMTAARALAEPKVKYAVSSDTPQFVIFSFDGSKSVAMLNETLNFAQKMQTEQKSLHFTYFINAAYFLTNKTARLYQPPEGPVGLSRIGFSNSTEDIAARVKAFNRAFAGGNEIGSHVVGHFDGTTWTYTQWKKEFDSFTSLMSNIPKNNPSLPIDAPTFLADIHGFRAPVLGVNSNLYKVLKDSHFTYDTSGITATDAWPTKDAGDVWHIPLTTVLVGPKKSLVVSMDYNLWTHQSGAKEVATKGTPLWNGYFNDVKSAYMNLFTEHYSHNRGPIVIGDHFSTWNDGVYWEALKAFAENVCGEPHVKCVTHKELVEYLNTSGTPTITHEQTQ